MKTLKNNLRLSSLVAIAALPATAFADLPQGFPGLKALLDSLATGVVQSLGYMLLTLATVAFFFGIVQFIWNARDGSAGKGMQKGKQFLVWGLVGIFVMFSVWGIIQFAQGVLGIQNYNSITVPSLNFDRDAAPVGTRNQQGANQVVGGAVVGGTGATGMSGGGSRTATGNATQDAAQRAYNACIDGGGSNASCTPTYQAAGGSGLPNAPISGCPYTNPDRCDEWQAAGGLNAQIETATPDQVYDNCRADDRSVEECNQVKTQYASGNSSCDGIANASAREACFEAANAGYSGDSTAGGYDPGYDGFSGTGGSVQTGTQAQSYFDEVNYSEPYYDNTDTNGFTASLEVLPDGDLYCSCDFWVTAEADDE